MKFRPAIIAAPVLGLVLCLAEPSVAAAQTQAPPTLSVSTIEQRLNAEGFRIVEIERYSRSIEVKGYDRNGVCMELYLDPRTGEVLRRERDDGCGTRRDDHGRRGRSDHH